jgi:hypothetical protein
MFNHPKILFLEWSFTAYGEEEDRDWCKYILSI